MMAIPSNPVMIHATHGSLNDHSEIAFMTADPGTSAAGPGIPGNSPRSAVPHDLITIGRA
jgi:hypothetical protein